MTKKTTPKKKTPAKKAVAKKAVAKSEIPHVSTRDQRIEASELRPIRRGTKQAAVLELIAEGATIEQVAAVTGSLTEARHTVRNLVGKGVGHVVESGVIRAIFPKGKKVGDCFLPEE